MRLFYLNKDVWCCRSDKGIGILIILSKRPYLN